MSVDIRSVGNRENFTVNSTQFEEIVPTRHSTPSPRQKMDKHSDDEDSGNEKGNKTPLESDYDSDDYEDDFEDEDPTNRKKAAEESHSVTSPRNNETRPPKHSTKAPSIASSRIRNDPRSKFRKRRSFGSEISYGATTRDMKKGWGKSKHRSAGVKGKSAIDSAVFDMNSLKEQELWNEVQFLKKELRKEQQENKTMHLIQLRHEKNLKTLHGQHNELPQMLQKHAAEVKTLQQITKKLHDSCNQKDHKIHDQDRKILKLEDECKRYKQLAEAKGMPEKSDLQNKLTKAETDIEKVENENTKLKRQLNLQEKTHVRGLKEQKDKVREAQANVKQMEEIYSCERERVKTLTKLVNNTNLYSGQLARLEKERETALPEGEKVPALPAPRKTKQRGKGSPNQPNRYNKETTKGEEKANKKPDSIFLTAQTSDTGSDMDKPKQTGEEPKLSITDGTDQGIAPTNMRETFVLHEPEKRKEDDFEKAIREEDERLRKEKEEAERIKKEEEERQERQRAERETKWREDSAKRVKEENERLEELARQAKEEELERVKEELRRQAAAREAREREEKRRAGGNSLVNGNDPFVEDEEARRKKDALLNRLKNMDNNNNPNDGGDFFSSGKDKNKPADHNDNIFGLDNNGPKGKPFNENDGFFGSKRDNKAMGESDDFFGSSNRGNDKPQREAIKSPPIKHFQSREADKNLHDGKPSSGLLSSPRGAPSPPASPDVFGVSGYKPSLIPRGNLRKKPNNLSWLNDKPSAKQDDDLFNDNSKKKPARGRRVLEEDMFGSLDKPKTNNKPSFLDDDFVKKNKNFGSASLSPTQNDVLLPRRKAIQGLPSPGISNRFDDNLDDGIEELTL